MKKALSLALAFVLALSLAGSALAKEYTLLTSYGGLVFDDALLAGTVNVDGTDVSIYATPSYAYIRKYGLSKNTVVTVSRFSFSEDMASGQVGSLVRQIDGEYFEQKGFSGFSETAYIDLSLELFGVEDVGGSLYFEVKETDNGDVTRFVLYCVYGTVAPAPEARFSSYGVYDMGSVRLEAAKVEQKTLTLTHEDKSMTFPLYVVSLRPGTGFVNDTGKADFYIYHLKDGSYHILRDTLASISGAQTIDDLIAFAKQQVPNAPADPGAYLFSYGMDPNGEAYLFALGESAAPAANTAYARSQTVELDGRAVTLPAYALKDAKGNETNYVKLRDLASLLNGTAAQFNVGWDAAAGALELQAKTVYTPNGSEMTTPFSGDRAYKNNTAPIRLNGAAADLQGIVLTDDAGGGYTYFKLRDVGKALGFNVGWSAARGIYIESDKPYAG